MARVAPTAARNKTRALASSRFESKVLPIHSVLKRLRLIGLVKGFTLISEFPYEKLDSAADSRWHRFCVRFGGAILDEALENQSRPAGGQPGPRRHQFVWHARAKSFACRSK